MSIPSSYTSFLAPLSSSKLYNEVRGCRERDKDPESHFETPYVVRLHNFHQLAEPKACFTFTHPTTGEIPEGDGPAAVTSRVLSTSVNTL